MDAPLQLLGWYFLDAGDTAQAIDFYQRKIEENPGSNQLLYRLAGIYERTAEVDKALVLLDELLEREPDNKDVVLTAVGLSLRVNLVQKARQYLIQWLARYPQDQGARKTLEDIDRQLRANREPASQ